jgi:endonuclease YncB( thermonuclease family)
MRNEIILISILLALSLQPLVLAAPGEAIGIVTYVTDGDTFYVQIQGYDERIGNITVRLADVDSPAINTTEGKDARNYTLEVLNGSIVSLDLDDKTGKDRYCRWVAVAFVEQNGTTANFNKMLVDSGHACIWDFCNNEFDPHA